VYGDLDISIINELPPGREPVKTQVATTYQRDKIYQHIDEEITKGSQVYVVCPMINESDTLGVKSVEAEAARLKRTIFSHRSIGVIHGKMRPEEKQRAMEKFKNAETDILVATTVVEVGVDVPNATIMLIEGAERFGLATLHQLRGRVGRGQKQGSCYLITSVDRQSKQRLELLEHYHDGFTLAQKDLELRGPGQLYGQRQHGLLDLRMANISDTKLIAEVRTIAQDFLGTNHDLLKYPIVAERVNQLKNLTSLD
jgi:ATP-dependent DNA helicase RecG